MLTRLMSSGLRWKWQAAAPCDTSLPSEQYPPEMRLHLEHSVWLQTALRSGVAVHMVGTDAVIWSAHPRQEWRVAWHRPAAGMQDQQFGHTHWKTRLSFHLVQAQALSAWAPTTPPPPTTMRCACDRRCQRRARANTMCATRMYGSAMVSGDAGAAESIRATCAARADCLGPSVNARNGACTCLHHLLHMHAGSQSFTFSQRLRSLALLSKSLVRFIAMMAHTLRCWQRPHQCWVLPSTSDQLH